MNSDPTQTTDTWNVCMGSDRMLHVRGYLTKPQSFDALIEAVRALAPLLPDSPAGEVDGDWAE